jgi:site-specific recombinase XerD
MPIPARQNAVARPQPRALTAEQFQQLADVPAVLVWLGNIHDPNTKRAYKGDVEAFVAFCGIETPEEFRQVRRAHVLAWRGVLESQELAPATIRRKLSAVSALFDYLLRATRSQASNGLPRTRTRARRRRSPTLKPSGYSKPRKVTT